MRDNLTVCLDIVTKLSSCKDLNTINFQLGLVAATLSQCLVELGPKPVDMTPELQRQVKCLSGEAVDNNNCFDCPVNKCNRIDCDPAIDECKGCCYNLCVRSVLEAMEDTDDDNCESDNCRACLFNECEKRDSCNKESGQCKICISNDCPKNNTDVLKVHALVDETAKLEERTVTYTHGDTSYNMRSRLDCYNGVKKVATSCWSCTHNKCTVKGCTKESSNCRDCPDNTCTEELTHE